MQRLLRYPLRALAAVAALCAGSALAAQVTIASGRLSMTAYDFTGWAICSLVYRGQQYIDAADHGRCLQSAVSFNWLGEGYNPTEAGNVIDGALPGPTTTVPLSVSSGRDSLATEVQMAFWQGGRSNHVLRKWVYAGVGGRNITEHRIAFEIPANEKHDVAQFEILTGYMPATFSKFRTFNPATGALGDITDGPGEQDLPVIFCADDNKCMGVYSPAALTWGGYGRWRFPDCVKWNMVTRVKNPAGSYRFKVFTAVGTLAEVQSSITWLSKM